MKKKIDTKKVKRYVGKFLGKADHSWEYAKYLVKYAAWVMKHKKKTRKMVLYIVSIITLLIAFGKIIQMLSPFAPPLKRNYLFGSNSFSAKNSIYSTKIGIKRVKKPFVEFETKDAKVSFLMLDTNEKAISLKRKGNKAIFSEVMASVDVTYEALKNGIKEEIILKERPETNEFLFAMEIEGARAGSVSTQFPEPVFFSEEGEYLFHFEKPFAFDAEGNRTENVKLQLKGGVVEGNYKIKYVVDPNWLYSPERAYPIVVDPTIVHDTTAEFAPGQFNRVSDEGSPQLEDYYQELPADESTVGIWHMNEGTDNTCSGGEDMCDSSGNGYHGTSQSGATFTSSAKLGSYSGNLDGTDDYVTLSSNVSNNIGNNITIEAWVYATALDEASVSRAIVTEAYTGDLNVEFALYLSGASHNLTAGFYDGSWHNVADTATFPTGRWVHLATTYDGNQVQIYQDGENIATSSDFNLSLPSGTNGWRIGRRWDIGNAGDMWQGYIDDVRISNTARTPEEIKAAASRSPYAIYTSPVIDLGSEITSWVDLSWTENGVATGDGETVFDSTDLVAQWNFNETSGTTANNDAEGTSCGGTPANCDGTLSGFDSTASQDADPDSSWTANNRRWGAGALQFDGVDSVVTTSYDSSLNITGGLTLSAWVKTAQSVRGDIITRYNATTPFPGYGMIKQNDGTLGCWVGDLTNGYVYSVDTIDDGKWHHVVCVHDSGTVYAYIDGKLSNSDTRTASLSETSTDVTIGNRDGGGAPFLGVIDTPSIYSSALSASKVLSNYNSSNIQFQTRVGPDNTPDGDWDAWTPTTNETQILSLNTDATNWSYTNTNYDGARNKSDEATLPIAEGTGSLQIEHRPNDNTGTVALWHLDETNGDNAGVDVFDETTNNHDGQFNGTGVATAVVNGISGKARSFNGTSDYISVTSTASLQLGTAQTIETWFKINTLPASFARMVGKGDGVNRNYGLWVAADGDLLYQIYNLGGTTTCNFWDDGGAGNDMNVQAGQWYNVVATYNGTDGKVYLDGVLVHSSSCTVTPANNTDTLNLGYQNSGPTYYNGSLDEVKISNVTRNAEDIAESYRLGKDSYLERSTLSSSVDLSDDNQVGFYIAADRPGTYLEATFGESDFVNGIEDANTVGLWHMDENTDDACNDGSNDVCDVSGNSNHGDVTSAPPVVQGKIGNGRKFDGSADFINFGTPSTLNFTTGAFTIEAWVNPTDTTAENIAGNDNLTNGHAMLLASGKLRLNTRGTTDVTTDSTTTVPTDQWTHVAAVYTGTGGERQLYINGVLDITESFTGSITSAIGNYNIGRRNDGVNYFSGTIDEVRVSNTARTADEIRQTYERSRRSHPITIDFAADLDSGDLITGSTDTGFTIDATAYGLGEKGSGLYQSDTVIIREVVDDTEYVAQGVVASVTKSSGAITVGSWNASSTFPSGGYTANASVFKWQLEYFDLNDVTLSGHIDAMDEMTLRFTNGSEGRTIWLDDIASFGDYMTTDTGSTISSDVERYFQYRAIYSSGDEAVSANLTNVTLDYITDELSLFLKFDENFGTTAYDHSPNSLNGTIAGASWTDSGRCISSTCLEFDGDGDYVSISDNDALDPSEITLQAWIRPNTNDIAGNIISKTNNSYRFRTISAGGDEYDIQFYDRGATNTLSTTTHLTLDEWHHIAVVGDSAGLKIYVDGILNNSNATAYGGTNVADDVVVGCYSASNTECFDGFIDNPKMYNYARSAAQIRADYVNQAGVKGAAASFGPDYSYLSDGLVGYWKMDTNASGSSWYDPDWTYRIPVTLTYSGSALTQYDVLIELDTETLITAGKMQSDCDDVRFSDSDEATPMDYWIESGCNTTTTQIWTRVPYIPDGGKTIYLYYGNGSAANAEQAWTGNFILFNNASCPSGWTSISGASADYDSKFPYGSATYGNTGGASSHAHSASGQSGGGSSTAVNNQIGAVTAQSPTHTHSMSVTLSSASVLPPYYNFIICQKPELDINSGLIVLEDSSLPGGFTAFTSVNGSFPRGAASAGGTGGVSTHSHSIPGGTTGSGSGAGTCVNYTTKSVAKPHTHSWNATTSDPADNTPPYLDLIFGSADSDTVAYADAITMADATPPLGWTRFSSLDSKIPRGAVTPGGTGGTSTHIHALNVQTNTPSSSGQCLEDITHANKNVSTGSHKHTLTIDSNTASSLPPYNSTVFVQRDTPSATTANGSEETDVGGGATTVSDKSGNDRTITGLNSPTLVAGKFGKGSEHVPASTEYYTLSSTIEGVKTVSFWTNPDSTTNHYLSLNSTAYIDSTTGTISTTGFTNPSIFVNGVESSTVSADSWSLVTITTETGTDASALNIGKVGLSSYFDGTMDEVRLYSRTLSPSEVQGIYEYAPGPIGYWPMDENTGTTTTYDKSGNENNGTLTSITESSWVPGKYGSVLNLDGTADYVDIGADPTIVDFGSGGFTLSAWINPDTLATSKSIIIKDEATANRQFVLQLDVTSSDELDFLVFDTDTTWKRLQTTNSNLTTNSWQYVTATSDGVGNLKIYVNGSEKTGTASGSGDGSMQATTANLRIGADDNSGGASKFFDGKIDEVRIHNYIRTSSQIIEDMNGGHPIGGSPISSRVGYWSFDEQVGQTTYDRGFGGNNGSRGADTSASTDDPTWKLEDDCKINGCLDFDGGDYVTITGEGAGFSSDNFTLSSWIYRDTDSGAAEFIIDNRDANTDGWILHIDSTDFIKCYYNATVITSTTTISTGQWYHTACTSDGSTLNLYINGTLEATSSITGSISETTNARIGARSHTSAASFFPGKIDEVKVYSTALTSSQILIDMNGGSSAAFGVLGASEKSIGAGGNEPIAYWNFNSGSTGTIYDKAGNSIDLINRNSVTYGPGKYGKAANFESGSSQYFGESVSATGDTYTSQPDETSSDDTFINSGATTTNYGTNIEFLTGKEGSALRRVLIKFDLTSIPSGATVNSATLDTYMNQEQSQGPAWHYVYRMIRGWVEGEATWNIAETGTNWGAAGASNTTTDRESTSLGSRLFSGTEAPGHKTWSLTTSKIGEIVGYTPTSTNNGFIIIGYEAGAYSTRYDFDSSNGVTASQRPKLTINYTYNAVSPDSNLNLTSDLSVAAWIKPESVTASTLFDIAGKWDYINESYLLAQYGDEIRFYIDSASNYITTDAANLSTGTWYHAMGTYDASAQSAKIYIDGIEQATTTTGTIPSSIGSNTDGAFIIGAEDISSTTTNFYDGLIDEVKVFDYELSQAQVSYNFNRGKPIEWWKFDECTGTTAYDSSGKGNNGVISIGSGGTNTSAGTCSGSAGEAWADGASGKYNASLEFDGNDDRIYCTDANCGGTIKLDFGASAAFSFGAWIKTSTTGVLQTIISKKADGGTGAGYQLYVRTANDIRCQLADGTNAAGPAGGTPTDGAWHHAMCVSDGSTAYLYIDAVLVSSASISTVTGSLDTSADFAAGTVGTTPSAYFTGQIDDARVYNYALTQSQVKIIRNQSAVRYGP